MSHIDDASTLPVTWWKSSRSDTGAQCVEFGIVDTSTEAVAIRDSKNPTGPALLLPHAPVNGLVEALKRGELH
ncbi:DUF397 domain-containing protein [Streptomyces sp. NRRL F-5126]|uniref:DUF397 domain-containing protein n=1 Tax=Streptomyces sp. NRRL F-5126 TaxID=1463857 RepID=UPI0004CB162A|nr:DUF397 domain-containing protein [Streptomyces sp. NRRL F-5126]